METSKNTTAFYFLAWSSFAISFLGVGVGLALMEAEWAVKAFFGMSYLFSVSSCFMVAKVVRDKQEEQSIINKVEKAKTQQLINKYTDPTD
ncbi:MAG: hypothetical protein EAZ97_00620 [Bacteroidetes bacterium]|nr:MAG: hypothetical protein EAZ97_00620 [Bacteroidota bacterium]